MDIQLPDDVLIHHYFLHIAVKAEETAIFYSQGQQIVMVLAIVSAGRANGSCLVSNVVVNLHSRYLQDSRCTNGEAWLPWKNNGDPFVGL